MNPKDRKHMKLSVLQVIFKVIIAVATALLGALGASIDTTGEERKD